MSLLTRVPANHILYPPPPPTVAQCPELFFPSGTGCFTVVDDPGRNMTWDECRQECQARGSVDLLVDLATFQKAEELETFSQTWMEISRSPCIVFHTYIICLIRWDYAAGEFLTLSS